MSTDFHNFGIVIGITKCCGTRWLQTWRILGHVVTFGDRLQASRDVALTVCFDINNSVTCVTCCVSHAASIRLSLCVSLSQVATSVASCHESSSSQQRGEFDKNREAEWESSETTERNEFEQITTMKAPFFQDLLNNVGLWLGKVVNSEDDSQII